MNNNIFEEIKKLNNTLNQFEWGYPDENGKNIVETDDFENYQLLSNNKFLENKIGTCWDYTNYEIIWFMKHGFIHTKNALRNEMACCYYVESEDESNHTWLAYMLNDFVYLFESSWKSKVGTFEFNSEQDLLNYFCKEFIKDLDQSDKRFVLYEFKQPKTGLTSNQYRAHIIQTGTMIRNIGRYYESVIRPWENTGFENLEESAHLKTFDYKWSDELEIVKSLPSNEQDLFFTK